MFKGTNSPSMAKIDKPIFDVLPGIESPDGCPYMKGIRPPSGLDHFCDELFSDRSFPCSPRDGGGYESTSTSVESSPIGWLPPFSSTSSSRDKSRLWKLSMMPKYVEVRDISSWGDRCEHKVEESDASGEDF